MSLEQMGDTGRMEALGDTEGLGAHDAGATLESQDATPSEPTAPEAPSGGQPAKPEAGEDDLRLMTDDEIAQLAPELQKEAKALRKRLQGSYTKRMQQLAARREQADFGERFATDPEFRQAVIRQYGQPTATQQLAQPTQTSAVKVPQEYVELRRNTLPAEMQWMAESLALGDYQRDLAFQERHVKPVESRLAEQQRTQALRDYQAVQSEFADRNPGWESHEDDMVDVLNFLKSTDLKHARWGNKMDLLYRLASMGEVEKQAVQTQIEKTAQAARARSITSTGARVTQSNIEDRVRDRKMSDSEAWKLATQEFRGRG